MKKYLLIVLLVGVWNCATTSGVINNIQIGMNKQQVMGIMGSPSSTSAKDGTEYLEYLLSTTPDDVMYGTRKAYFVRLVNGKVDSYGKVGDFDSTKDPTINIKSDENIKIETSDELFNELRKIKGLLDDGIISEEEYNSLKEKALTKY